MRPDRNFSSEKDEEVIFNNKYNVQLDYQASGNLSKWSRTVGRLSNNNRLSNVCDSAAAAAFIRDDWDGGRRLSHKGIIWDR